MRRIDPDSTPKPIFALVERYARIRVPFHRHHRHQLILVGTGTLSIQTKNHRWTIPPQRGVWIASETVHRIASPTPFTLTTCYIEPDHLQLGSEGIVVVDQLTQALLPEVANLGSDWHEPQAFRLVDVLLDRLKNLPNPQSGLPLPVADSPLEKLTGHLLRNPSSQEPLAVLGPRAGMSERTAARQFRDQLGVRFGVWRRKLRLQTGLAQLGAGASVTTTAFDVGYKDVSSFISAFRTEYGRSPGEMFTSKRHGAQTSETPASKSWRRVTRY